MDSTFRLFGLNDSREFSGRVSEFLDVPLSKHVEFYFDDKEPYLRSDVNVRGCDVYVIQSLYSDEKESVSEKFAKLLFFIGSLVDASARRITAVVPYLGFSRQDRKTESRAPITAKYVAILLESVGCNRLVTMDVHNLSAFQNGFRIQTDTLEAKNLLADYVSDNIKLSLSDGNDSIDPAAALKNLVVLSPDAGGMTRAMRFRKSLGKKLGTDVGLSYLDKVRTFDKVEGFNIIGDVEKKDVVIVDDIISTGGTLKECKRAVEKNGGSVWGACATHGLFVGEAINNLEDFERIIVTDTVAPFRFERCSNLKIISTSRMFSQAIRRTHEEGGSISDLLG